MSNYNLSQFREKIKSTERWLTTELSSLRTGRVSPAILDSVSVESYGSKMSINHVATISIEDAKTLKITPWDNSLVKEIERGVLAANLGVSVAPDSNGVRVSFPDLTEERRKTLMKLARAKLEEARVVVRQERDKVLSDIQTKEKEGELTEDDKFRYREDVQKFVDETNKNLESLVVKKEEEIVS